MLKNQISLFEYGISGGIPLQSYKDVSLGDTVCFITDNCGKAKAVITRICKDGTLFGNIFESENHFYGKDLPIPYKCIINNLTKNTKEEEFEYE